MSLQTRPGFSPVERQSEAGAELKAGYMSRKLERFPAAATARYPWDELLDGEVWELVSGEDFSSKPTTIIANARLQAKRRGGTVRTRLFQNGDRASVVLQFRSAQ